MSKQLNKASFLPSFLLVASNNKWFRVTLVLLTSLVIELNNY